MTTGFIVELSTGAGSSVESSTRGWCPARAPVCETHLRSRLGTLLRSSPETLVGEKCRSFDSVSSLPDKPSSVVSAYLVALLGARDPRPGARPSEVGYHLEVRGGRRGRLGRHFPNRPRNGLSPAPADPRFYPTTLVFSRGPRHVNKTLLYYSVRTGLMSVVRADGPSWLP